ncbi:MAG: energy-coupling factor transporter transmembrane protein EcfT [Spirochaetales bacterium]|nr:energy-coupling factor transporter transmembrane protein EcfT [Spirochaetales bacterium]
MDRVIFRYFPGDSLIHRFDPRIKLPGCALFCYAALQPGPRNLAITAGALLAAFLFARIPLKTLLIDFLRFVPLLTALFLAVFFSSDDGGPLVPAALAAGRFALLILAGNLLIQTTALSRISAAVRWFLTPLPRRLAGRLGTMIGLSVGLIPLFFQELEESRDALKARGLRARKQPLRWAVKLLTPLLARVFLRTEEMAEAMEGRCYSDERSSLPLKAQGIDWLFGLAVILLVLAICQT